MKTSLSTPLAAFALLLTLAAPLRAIVTGQPAAVTLGPDLINNGGFSSTYSAGTASAATPGQLNYNGYGVTGWTSTVANGYNFLFNPTLAGSAAYTSSGQNGNVQLYTSANGGSATAPASLVSPVGGNFLALSGAVQPGSLTQVLNGLTAGQDYQLSFWWAASQPAGFTGVTTDSLGVTFGNQSFSTATVTNPDHGFTPWTRVTYTFRPSSTSQTLGFLAVGGPSGTQEPFALLDGVTLQAMVPEPSSWALFAVGAGVLGLAVRRHRGRAVRRV